MLLIRTGHTCSSPMSLNVGGVNHGIAIFVHLLCKNPKNFFKNPALAPTSESGINYSPISIKLRYLPPGRTNSDIPENSA